MSKPKKKKKKDYFAGQKKSKMHITVKADATDQNDSNAVKKQEKGWKAAKKWKRKT